MLGPLNRDDLIKDRLRKVLSASGAESLALFRRVDANQADSMVCISGIQHGDRITVLNAYNSSLEDNRGCDVSGVTTIG
jgi:hypothetical protein